MLTKKRVLALCSGGFDSIVMLKELLEDPVVEKLNLLYLDYGQKSKYIELKKTLGFAKLHSLSVMTHTLAPMPWVSSSAILGSNNDPSMGALYVPMRNFIFLSYAVSIAEAKGFTHVYSAILGGGSYPDTTDDFMNQINCVSECCGVKCVFPFRCMDKYNLASLAKEADYDLKIDEFFSCNLPVNEIEPCGVCPDCLCIKYIYENIL